jgi:hypothetical protein
MLATVIAHHMLSSIINSAHWGPVDKTIDPYLDLSQTLSMSETHQVQKTTLSLSLTRTHRTLLSTR